MACPNTPLERPDNPLLLSRQTLGFLSTERLPWGAEPLFQDGRIILPGASGAAAAVATAASACANAEGLTVAASAFQATIATYQVPTSYVGLVFAVFARPLSLLGYDSGHVSFGFRANGRLSLLPATLFGLRRNREQPFRVACVSPPGTSFTLIATNASTATWHAVEGYFEGFTMRQDLYRKLIAEDA